MESSISSILHMFVCVALHA